MKFLTKGQTLELHPIRAEAYQIAPVVEFDHLELRIGYNTPWVIDTKGRSFKTSDFKGLIFNR